jgi:hypothetical protein
MFARGDGTGELDSAAVEQQLLGHGRFAGVGVRNNCKCPPPRYFLRNIHKGAKCSARIRQRNAYLRRFPT